MLTGRRFNLEIATLAANDLNGKRALTTIPAGDHRQGGGGSK